MASRAPGLRSALMMMVVVAVTNALATNVPDPKIFRANDTLLGTPVRCTDAEKACLRYNRLLHRASGMCYRVGSSGPCLDRVFLLDRQEFESGSGRLVGVCQDPGRCPDHRFRMAFDRKCYTGKEVFGTFCDVKKGASAWPYFFGGYECLCEGPQCPAPRYLEQPNESGKCLFPNFRNDLSSNFFPRLPVGDLECSSAHGFCFTGGEVAFGADKRCHKLLEQGPCPEGEHLVLDKQQAQQSQKIFAKCVPAERCPAGNKFLTYRQACVKEKDIEKILCPELSIFTDIFGESVCRFKEESYKVVLKSLGGGRCKLKYNVQLTGPQELPCTSTDPLDCLSSEQFDPDLLFSFGNM